MAVGGDGRRARTVVALAALAVALTTAVAFTTAVAAPASAATTTTTSSTTTTSVAPAPSTSTGPTTTVHTCPGLDDLAAVAFVGEAISRDHDNVTFEISSVSHGSLTGPTVVVGFPGDVRFVKVGERYAVIAVPTAAGGSPGATTTAPPQGAAPRAPFEAKVRAGHDPCALLTTREDGTPIDTGVLSPLVRHWPLVVGAVLAPLVAVVLLLLVLGLVKRLVLSLRWRRRRVHGAR